MNRGARSHLAASIAGGVIVALGLVVFGVTGRRQVQTIIEQSPVPIQRTAGSSALTPGAIYQRDAASVVYVSARLVDPQLTPFDVGHQFQTGTMTGSGFLIDRAGDVLTDYHLLAGASHSSGILVRFEGGLQRSAAVVAEDPTHDLAVIRVDLHGMPPIRPLTLGNSALVRIGDPALAIGDPYGLDRTLSSGIISSLSHELASAGGLVLDNVIQTDQPPDAAASGGPLLDGSGNVIGIESQITGPEGTIEPFATPIDAAAPLLARAHHPGAISFAYVGLSGLESGGPHPVVTITGVVAHSPAAVAGLRVGDILDRVGGESVSTPSDVTALVSSRSPGQRLSFEIIRRRRYHTFLVVLGARR